MTPPPSKHPALSMTTCTLDSPSFDDLEFENLNSYKTKAYILQAAKQTRQDFCETAKFQSLKRAILDTLAHEKHVPLCQEIAGKTYHFLQNDAHPKGLYRVSSAARFRAGSPCWEVLFSVADFDEILGENVYLSGVSHCPGYPERVLLNLSLAGSDSAFTLEFDLAEKHLVAGGFHFPAGKNHIVWRDMDSIWLGAAWDETLRTTSGYAKNVYCLTREQTFDECKPLFEAEKNDVSAKARRYFDGSGGVLDIIEVAHGFYEKTHYHVNRHAQLLRLNIPCDAQVCGYLGGCLLLLLHSDFSHAKQRYRAGSVLAISLNKNGLGKATLLFEPDNETSLYCLETTRQFVVLTVLHNINCKLHLWRFQQGAWAQVPTPPEVPQTGTLEISDRPPGGDMIYLCHSHFTQPMTLFALDLSLMQLFVIRKQKPLFNADNLRVTQHSTTSSDGTTIPYFHVSDGQHNAPTLVSVYGGFGLAQLPHYLNLFGRFWLAAGGAFVSANVRGGSEFGPTWHQAAIKHNKHKSADDTIAVIKDLHNKNLTKATCTALQGASNGALVAGSVLCREPEHLGALVLESPLSDMLRYHQLLSGASWLQEYGDPDNPHDHDYLQQFSPYHNLKSGQHYPPTLISTRLNDDRTHPAHALKFHAKLSRLGAKTWLDVQQQGGHEGSSAHESVAHEVALLITFLQATLHE